MDCDYCGIQDLKKAVCETCADHGDCISAEDVDDMPSDAMRVIEWADRERVLNGLPPGVYAYFERCAEDLR